MHNILSPTRPGWENRVAHNLGIGTMALTMPLP